MGWFDIIKIHKLQSNVSEKLELQSNFRDVVTRKVDEAIGKLDYDEDDYTLFEWITDYPVKIFFFHIMFLALVMVLLRFLQLQSQRHL